MGGVPVLFYVAVLGINYGWVPDQKGGVEYIIQVEPEKLRAVERAGEISSTIPAEVQGHVSRVVIRVGTGPVPRETPTQFARKTSYGSIRSNDDADSATMSAPSMTGGSQQSFKPDPAPQFSIPGSGSRPSTQPQNNSGNVRVEPPRPSTASASRNWNSDRGASPFGGSGNTNATRPSTASGRNESNSMAGNGRSQTNNATGSPFGSPFSQGNSAQSNNSTANSRNTFNAGARLGAAPSGMDLRGGRDGQRIADANLNAPLNRSAGDGPFFGPQTREEAEAALRSSGQAGASQSNNFPRVTPNRKAAWAGVPRENKEWLVSQGWTQQSYEYYRDQGGIFFRDVMPIDIDGYPISPSMQSIGNKPYTSRAEILAAYPELTNPTARDNAFAGTGSNLGDPNAGRSNTFNPNPNRVPSLERDARDIQNVAAAQANTRDDRYTMGASGLGSTGLGSTNSANDYANNLDRLSNRGYQSPDNRATSDQFATNRTNTGSRFTDDPRLRGNTAIDDQRYQDPRYDDRAYSVPSRTSDPTHGQLDQGYGSDSRSPARSASDRIASTFDDRGYDDRDYGAARGSSVRSASDARFARDTIDPRDRALTDRDARDSNYPQYASTRTRSSDPEQTDSRLASNAELARRAQAAEEEARREAEALAIAQAEIDQQKDNARTQRLFNALLLASVVGNFYLVYWLKNLRYRFRDMVASKRSPSTPISTVA